MRYAEVEELLRMISGLDRRPFPEGAAGDWYPIMTGVEFNDARQAVLDHYGSYGARDSQGNARQILPGDVRTRARAIALVRERAEARKALPAGPAPVETTEVALSARAKARLVAEEAKAAYRAANPDTPGWEPSRSARRRLVRV